MTCVVVRVLLGFLYLSLVWLLIEFGSREQAPGTVLMVPGAFFFGGFFRGDEVIRRQSLF